LHTWIWNSGKQRVHQSSLFEQPPFVIENLALRQQLAVMRKSLIIIRGNLIHIIESPANALQESHRILKQGGRLIIATYTNYGMKLFEKIKLGFRFAKGWGNPRQY